MHRALAAFLLLCSPASALVITEIMYNQPPTPGDPQGAAEDLEFVELYNELAVPVDLSGYRFTKGIRYQFPTGYRADGKPLASLGRGEYLVLASDAAAFQAKYGFAPFGQYYGRLNNGGDKIVLENDAGDPYDPAEPLNTRGRREGAYVIAFEYDDEGKWPVACDGTGHTLCLIDPFGDQGDPDNWTASPRLWGTPGQPNGLEDAWIETEIFAGGSPGWKYLKGTAEPPSAWNTRTFDAGAWADGRTPIGYGEPNLGTVLDDMQNRYYSFYARRVFTLAGTAGIESLILHVTTDDGFVAYLNGVEVGRYNVAGTPPAHNTAADGPVEPPSQQVCDITAFKNLLVAGANVIAIQTHNVNLPSTDAFMDARLVRRAFAPGGVPATPLKINEVRFLADGNRFIELYNPSASPVDLAGCYLSTDANDLAAHALSGTVPARGFLAVDENENLSLALRYDDPPPPPPAIDRGRLRVFLTYIPDPADPSRTAVVLAERFEGDLPYGWSIGRVPDGDTGAWYRMSVPSRGAANALAPGDVTTAVVINEIMYHPYPEDDPYSEADDLLYASNLEYIELHNRGAAPVDLSGWRFSKGVSYTFNEGTILEPGGYLVVAKNPDRITAVYGIADVLGPYEGVLANGGERVRLKDANNNTANEVRYYDSGRWDKWADGLGSSLELIDPRQDNRFPGAWMGSDDSGKSQWVTVTYSGTHNQFWGGESELHMHLCGKGEVLIDELQMCTDSRFSTANLAKGGGFNTPADYTSNWIKSGDTGGNHIDTHWTSEDAFAGAGCLKVVASGRGDSGFNRLESDTTDSLSSRTYYLRYRAKWLRGYNVFMTRTHGHGCARASVIQMPDRLGTPGARNSVYAANMGPVYGRLRQNPVVPNDGEPVTVTVEIRDSDGVASAAIKYRLDTAPTYSQAPMNDLGTGSDSIAGDGIWTGVIPGQAAGSIVEFYVEAADAGGRVTQWPPLPPAGAPATVLKDLAVYRVGDRRTPGVRPMYRITLTRDAQAALQARRSLSNHLVPCSFVLNEKEMIYNCGQRFRGSPFIRGGGIGGFTWSGIRIRFPSDQRLFGLLRELNLDGGGGSTGLNDISAYYLERKLVGATPGVYGAHSWSSFVDVRYLAGTTANNYVCEHNQKVDADYLSYWYAGRDLGTLHKVDDWFEFNDSGGFNNRQADFRYTSADKEDHYRQNYKLRSREKDDDFSELIEISQAITTLSGANLDARMAELMDVRQWNNILSVRLFIDDWDTLGASRGKNAYIYLPSGEPEGRRWQLLPWDSDLIFGNTNAPIYPTGAFPQMVKLWSRPWVKRQINADYRYLIGEVLSNNRYQTWLDWVADSSGLSRQSHGSWCQARAAVVLSQLPPDQSWPFDITAPRGNPYVSNAPSVMVQGQAPANADRFFAGGEEITAQLRWTNSPATQWEYGPIALQLGLNEIPFAALTRTGEPLASKLLRVLYTTEEPPRITAVYPEQGITIGGETITILGTNFQSGITAAFGATPAAGVLRVSATELRVTTPAHAAGATYVSVTNPDGLPGFFEPFAFVPIPPPAIAYVAPALGYTGGGTRVKIRGNYFQPGIKVFFGGTPASAVHHYGLGEVDAVTPAHAAGAVAITLRNIDDQQTTRAGAFTYVVDQAPEIASITPDEGPRSGNTAVTITGANFKPGADVWFGPNPGMAVTFVSAGELRCRTPAETEGDTFVAVRVENPDGQLAWIPSGFRYASGVVSCEQGDANGDGLINVADVVAILEGLFRGGGNLRCERAADLNRDAHVDIADAVALLGRLFP